MIKQLVKFPLFQLWRQLHRQHIIIFMVHGVVDYRYQTTWRPLRRQLTVENLDSGLAALSQYYRFVSLDQAVTMLTGEAPMLPFSAVLTFDDGYRNNVTHALPILQRHGIPAIFFLATGHIERREPFWYDRLDYAIQHLKKEQVVRFGGRDFLFHPGQNELLHSTFSKLRFAVKSDQRYYKNNIQDVGKIADLLEGNAGCRLADIFEEDHYTAVMSWEEARKAADAGISMGSHTVDHLLLDRLDERTVRRQLCDSKQIIESRLGMPCRHLCYPNSNWSEQVVSLSCSAGFVAAVTTQHGFASSDDNLLTLPRMNFPNTADILTLLCRAGGVPFC